jgi:FAD/FMN-containing dehydrogenase
VLGLRDELRDLFDRQGACHLQIGKYYPFTEMMNNETLPRVLQGVKNLLDPQRLVNPGSLGLR